jgi:hypothetical protein
MAKGSVTCKNIKGDVAASGSVTCNDVSGGGINAGGSVSVKGGLRVGGKR